MRRVPALVQNRRLKANLFALVNFPRQGHGRFQEVVRKFHDVPRTLQTYQRQPQNVPTTRQKRLLDAAKRSQIATNSMQDALKTPS